MISEEAQKDLDQVSLEIEIAEILTEFIESAEPYELLEMAMVMMKDCECSVCEKLDGLCDQLHELI